MNESIPYDRPVECDVAIVGADLAGVITGAMLARRGLDVVMIDQPPQVGGGGGGTPYRGYWLDGGHREGLDVTDLQVGWRWGQVAAREAQVEVAMRPVENPLLVHLLPEFPPRDPAPVVDGDWSPRGFNRLAREVLGVPEALLPAFGEALGKLSGTTVEQRDAAIEQTLEAWIAENVQHPEIGRAVLTMAKTIFCEYPERASAGRLMTFFSPRTGDEPMQSGFGDDAECGGMQGLVAPFVRVMEECGARIWLDHEPVEVLFDGPRACGVVALNSSQLVLELRAKHVVLARPVWDAVRLMPPERVTPDFAEMARRLEDESGDGLSLQFGLSRIPRLRSTGAEEQHAGWNRFFVGEERRYRGGFHIPSLSSRASAPEGHHLLQCMIVRWLRRDERPGWRETREVLDAARATLEVLYSDFDDCVEWQAYQWVKRPAAMAWFWAPVRRHGLCPPGCEDLYLATSTFESEAGPVDVCAHAGVEAARAILDRC
ncbi:FAD-dependent monooxygenase [Myxococcota bacterium]|nr:FAD-dependent monooxygenase [Myxococcota bacterium]